MSVEPKKQTRRLWIGWVLFAVFVLYPLSIGPAYSLMYRAASRRAFQTYCAFYAPLISASLHCRPLNQVIDWYGRLWIRSDYTAPVPFALRESGESDD
jgi:hypothetical protein